MQFSVQSGVASVQAEKPTSASLNTLRPHYVQVSATRASIIFGEDNLCLHDLLLCANFIAMLSQAGQCVYNVLTRAQAGVLTVMLP